MSSPLFVPSIQSASRIGSEPAGRVPPTTARMKYSASTGIRCTAWIAFGSVSPVASYSVSTFGLGWIFRERAERRTSVGFIVPGPKIAVRAIRSADARYFSISTGGTDNTAPIVSNP